MWECPFQLEFVSLWHVTTSSATVPDPHSALVRAGFSACSIKERKYLAVTIVTACWALLSPQNHWGGSASAIGDCWSQAPWGRWLLLQHTFYYTACCKCGSFERKKKVTVVTKQVSNPATWSHETNKQAFGKAALATTLQPLWLCFRMWRGSRDNFKITKLESWLHLYFIKIAA